MRLLATLVLTALLAGQPAFAQSSLQSEKQTTKKITTSPMTASTAEVLARGAGAIFSEDFESSTDEETPPGWVVDNTNGDALQWLAIEQPTRAHTGNFAAAVFWNSAAAADDWLISPGFALDAGVTYRITAWFKPGDAGFGTAESMEVTIGTGQTVADMTELLLDINGEAAGDYQQLQVDYTPGAAGSYNLGFHCDSAADQYFCAVDDISVEVAPSGPALSVSTTAIDYGTIAAGGTATETVTLSNTGAGTLTISSIIASGDDAFSVDLTGTSLSLDAGAMTTFEVSFAPSTVTTYSGSVAIASDDPTSPASISLSGEAGDAPDNDDIANATAINALGTYAGTNLLATLEIGEVVPSCQESQGSSVFWAYTPASDGAITIDLSASDFDTVLTFHENDGTEIACDDDGGDGLTSKLSNLEVTGGTTYLIRIAGFQSSTGAVAQGNISFDITEGQTLGASFDGNTDQGPFTRPFVSASTGACAPSGTGADVMYGATDIEVASDGTFTLVLTNYAFDGVLIVYEGGGFDPMNVCDNLVSYEDVAGAGEDETEADLALTAGTYTVVVSGFVTADTGTYTVNLLGDGVTPVANEHGSPSLATTLRTPQPNPTTSVARVTLDLQSPEVVTVKVLDLLGREVLVLHEGPLAGGTSHTFQVSTSALPAGQYLIRAQGESFASTKRLTVVR